MELKKLELLKIRAFRLHRERERERERERDLGGGLETWKRNTEYGQAMGKEGRKNTVRDVYPGDPRGLR
jgi:hypothetical protein